MHFATSSGKPTTAARDQLQYGTIYDGAVVGMAPTDNAVAVKLDKLGVTLPACQFAAGIFSGLLGYKLTYYPPQGTKVKVLYSDVSYIIACVPSDKPDEHGNGSRTITGDPLARRDLANAQAGVSHRAHTAPEDLLEGEFELTNMLGVALTMLTNLAKLSAGDRAVVECHLLNEMVRVVSTTFRHHSSFGDFEIYNNGRLNVVWNGTSYEHEAFGQLGPKDPKIPVADNLTQFDQIDRVLDTGRWRFSNYVGFLGDFLHFFVTDPTATIGKLAEDALRSGKAHLHVGMDGTILMQSVAEIVLERVCRIPVPVQIKPDDDPGATKAQDFNRLEASFNKLWNYGTDPRDMGKTVYQLREYARWLSGFHSLARFHQVEAKGKEYRIPGETEIPAPEWTNKETDREQANTGSAVRYRDTYSTIRVMRDGSHVNLDGYGNACVMGIAGVSISSVTDINIEAAGDVNIVAGQNLNIKARRSIEMSAITGGLKLKARAWWHALCERGTLWIKSDAVDPAKDDVSAPDSPDDPEPEVYDKAVILEASRGGSVVQSERQLLIQTKGAPDSDDEADVTASLILQTKHGDVKARAGRHLGLRAAQKMKFKAGQEWLVSCGKAIWQVTQQFFDINHYLTLRGSTLHTQDIRANQLNAARSVRGPKRGAQPDPAAAASRTPLRPHFNHIDKMPEDGSLDPQLATADDTAALSDFIAADAPSGPVPAFPTKTPQWDYEILNPEQRYESLSQQRIRNDVAEDGSDLYGTWTWSSDRLKSAPGTGSTAPWASKVKHLVHTGGEALHKPSATPYKNLGTRQTALKAQSVVFRYIKRQNP